jgi:hypothetical protein
MTPGALNANMVMGSEQERRDSSVALILLPLSAAAQGTQWDMLVCRQLSMTSLSLASTTRFEGQQSSWRGCPKTPWPVTLGCAAHDIQWDGERVVVPATECFVYIAEDDILEKAGWTYDTLMRHERGHCNGWPQSHPGARMLTTSNEPGILPRYPVPERGQWPSDLRKRERELKNESR